MLVFEGVILGVIEYIIFALCGVVCCLFSAVVIGVGVFFLMKGSGDSDAAPAIREEPQVAAATPRPPVEGAEGFDEEEMATVVAPPPPGVMSNVPAAPPPPAPKETNDEPHPPQMPSLSDAPPPPKKKTPPRPPPRTSGQTIIAFDDDDDDYDY